MKPATNRVSRLVVEIDRRADLLYQPLVEHDNLVSQRHGLYLVMGHVDHRRAKPLVQLRQFDPHLGA